MHDRILNRWIRDFEREGYRIFGSKIIYGGKRHPKGEIDLLMQDKYLTVCEVKTSYRQFEHGLEQLNRLDEYFGNLEKYLIVGREIYYLYKFDKSKLD